MSQDETTWRRFPIQSSIMLAPVRFTCSWPYLCTKSLVSVSVNYSFTFYQLFCINLTYPMFVGPGCQSDTVAKHNRASGC